MKLAVINGDRRLAERGLRGTCPGCGQAVIPKCGTKKLHHWAHVSTTLCDHWWEQETQWHRDWKDRFPLEWQERRRRAPDGEWHIADVLTSAGVAVEFQRSPLSDAERRSREHFHRRIVWIVDGTRLVRDQTSFQRHLVSAPVALSQYLTFVFPAAGAPIVERWTGCHSIYLDFGGTSFGIRGLPDERILWRLRYGKSGVIAMPVSYEAFVEHHTSGTPLVGFRISIKREIRLTEFQRHLMRKKRRRPRF